MTRNFYLKKDHPDLPDYYTVNIWYISGSFETFKLVSHRILQTRTIEMVTTEDIWHLVPLENVKRMEFDRNFSKVVAIREKLAAEKKEGKDGNS